MTYYGKLKEAQLGIDGGQIPEKPSLLILYEQVVRFDTLPLEGGLLDQYWQLTAELSVVAEVVEMNKPKPKDTSNAPAHQPANLSAYRAF